MSCTLVLHGSKQEFERQSGNAKIMRLSGAKIVFIDQTNQIGTTMDKAVKDYKEEDKTPYYIWGGGHTLEGGLAYIDAIQELKDFSINNDWFPEYIFHASGTGSTQSGIMAGLDKYDFNKTKVIGISVGRKADQAKEIVQDFYEKLCAHYDIKITNREAIVVDDYLMGGYGLFDEELKKFSENSLKNYGFALDTCYTGKAFYGMLDYIKKNKLDNNHVLFWHTGGILNFLAE